MSRRRKRRRPKRIRRRRRKRKKRKRKRRRKRKKRRRTKVRRKRKRKRRKRKIKSLLRVAKLLGISYNLKLSLGRGSWLKLWKRTRQTRPARFMWNREYRALECQECHWNLLKIEGSRSQTSWITKLSIEEGRREYLELSHLWTKLMRIRII